MNLKLYIGAHKTATTHVQHLLAANRRTLALHNVSLSIPSDIRPVWFPSFNKYVRNKNIAELKAITDTSPVDGVWIFAEENFSGVPYDLKTKAGIYPSLYERLSVLKDIFPEAKLEVFFSIRSYDTYYASSYLEVVRNKGYIPFEEYFDEERYINNSWFQVIKMIVDALGSQQRITLWKYENFSQILQRVLKGLTELEVDLINEIISRYEVDRTRPSISQKTLSIFGSLDPIEDLQAAQRVLEDLNRKYPASLENGYFKPFGDNRTQIFKEQYRKDVVAISTSFPDINFLKVNDQAGL